MSKGKDFRAPRKRGFDDDGPMPYESRPRPGRSFGGAPDGGGFGGPPMGGGSAPVDSGAPPVDAVERLMGAKPEARFAFIQERAPKSLELIDL